MSSNNKRLRLTSPKGVAKFPWLTVPDTRFNPDGEYRVSLLLDPHDPETAPFMDLLDTHADKSVEKAKADLTRRGRAGHAKAVMKVEPYRPETNQEGEDTGLIEFRFKMRAIVKSRKTGEEFTLTPHLFDSFGQPIDPEKVRIGGGSIIRVNFTPFPYYVPARKEAGISLQLNAVQVIELVQGGGKDFSFFGFDAEDSTDGDLGNDDFSYGEVDF